MSVEEMIARLPSLSAADLARLERALTDAKEHGAPDAESEDPRTAEAFDRLARGWCEAGGRETAATIDEALYRAEP